MITLSDNNSDDSNVYNDNGFDNDYDNIDKW